jgi:uncharacterized membrane protein YccC
MRSTLSQVIASALRVDWSRLEGLAALRCAVGVATPLLLGLAIDQPLVGVFGAAGAFGVGFGSFQGAYRSRAGLMLLAAAGVAFSVFVGSLAGHSSTATVAVAALWAFAGGLLVALGHGASFVGLQSIVALLIAGGYPSDPPGAAARAALAFAGGLIQTLLVVVIWPLRRFAAERRSLAAVYRSLAAYASAIPAREALPPEPHTLAVTASPLSDPQPFARHGEPFVFQALLDEAERVRASLAALAIRYRRLEEADRAAATALTGATARALAEIADALDEGRELREPAGLSRSLAGCVPRLVVRTPAESLLGQIRAAWQTAGMLTAVQARLAPRREATESRRPRPAMRDALITLRANLTTRSTACRHALRLTAILTLAAAVARVLELPRGYWLPMTIALVLKPDSRDTFVFSIARVAGTLLGAAGATAITLLLAPGPIALIVLVLGFAWGAYAFRIANYGAASACITGYVVFLVALAGIPQVTAASDRIVYTAIAGALALGASAAWPTWTATGARPAIAAMLEAQSAYVGPLLAAHADPSDRELARLDALRVASRLARSNAEAIVERMLGEPPSRNALTPRIAVGIIAAARRIALAALSLHAGVEHGLRTGVPGVQDLAAEVAAGLSLLAKAVREGSPLPSLPRLRQTQLAPGTTSHDVLSDEMDLIVEGIEAIGDLLANHATLELEAAASRPPAIHAG